MNTPRIFIASLLILLPLLPLSAGTLLTIYQDGLYSFQSDIGVPAQRQFGISGLPESIDPYSIVLVPVSKEMKLSSWELAGPRSGAVSDPLSCLTNRHVDIIDSADHAFKGILLRAYPESLLLAQDGSGQRFLLSRKDIKGIQLSQDSVSCLTDRPAGFSIGMKFDSSVPGVLRLFYQARGLSCSPLYKVFLDEKAGKLELLSEFYLENNTAADYTNAELEYLEADLFGGNIPSPPPRALMRMEEKAVEESSPEEMVPQDVFEYTRYRVKADRLGAFSRLHVTRFRIADILFRKSYYYNFTLDRGQGSVLAKVSFTNNKSIGLGSTLPRGEVKIYSVEDAAIRLIGDNSVARTMASDEVRLLPGFSRDLKVERSAQGQKRVSDRIMEQTVQFTVRNDKSEAASLEIEEPLYGVWEIKNSSDKYKKNGIRSISFFLDVPPKSERTVSYTVWQRQ